MELASQHPLLEKVNTITDSLSQVEFAALTSELKNTLTEAKNVMKSINDGEGSVGKLMTDEAVYDNLNAKIFQISLRPGILIVQIIPDLSNRSPKNRENGLLIKKALEIANFDFVNPPKTHSFF